MTNTKSNITLDTFDFFPHHFGMTKSSSSDAVEIIASQFIHALENPTPESPFKVEEPALASIKNLSEIFKFAVKPLDTQQPQQGNQFIRVEHFTQIVPRVVGDTP